MENMERHILVMRNLPIGHVLIQLYIERLLMITNIQSGQHYGIWMMHARKKSKSMTKKCLILRKVAMIVKNLFVQDQQKKKNTILSKVGGCLIEKLFRKALY